MRSSSNRTDDQATTVAGDWGADLSRLIRQALNLRAVIKQQCRQLGAGSTQAVTDLTVSVL